MTSERSDPVLEARLRHEPGALAWLAAAIAKRGGVLWIARAGRASRTGPGEHARGADMEGPAAPRAITP